MRCRPLVFISLLFLGACLDTKDYDLDQLNISPSFAMPLASGDLSLMDLIADKDSAYVKTYSDGLLYFSYRKTLASQGIRQLFTLTNKTFNTGVDLAPLTLSPRIKDYRSDSIVQNLDLNLSPEQLNELGLKSGTLSYTINTTPALPSITYAVNVILTDVVDVNTQVPLNFTSGVGSGSKSLQNYKINMSSNKFNVKLVFILKANVNSQFIPPGARVNVQLTFGSMVASYVKGFFGDRTIPIPNQSLDLSVFSNSLKKSPVAIVQPVVKLLLSNDNGVPTELTFSGLQAKKTGSTLPLQITPTNPITMSYPSVLGTSASTGITVGNSTDLINFLPTTMEYSASVRINKGLSSGNNFLADTSKLRITLATEIPLYGRATSMFMSDTLKMDLGSVKESSINTARMKIKAINQLPLDAYLQFYMTDKNYVILDSLLTPNQTYFVKGSAVTGTGELLTAGSADTQIDLNKDKINKLFTSSYLIVKAKLNTSKDANGALLNVKFKSTYKLNLNVGLNVKLNLSSK